MNDGPQTTRLRHELKRRRLTVTRVESVGPRMMRIVLQGEDLRGFSSPGFDDHIKVFFPGGMRDFTPRHYDETTQELWIDLVLHDAGPAAEWARSAAPGLELEIGGPKGSALIALQGIDSHVFVGDETALPAIARRLSELAPGANAAALIEVEEHETWPPLSGPAALRTHWVSRRQDAEPGAALIEMLRKEHFAPRSFVWVACESSAARAIRRHLMAERGLDKRWIKAAGYWRRNAAGSHERIEDD